MLFSVENIDGNKEKGADEDAFMQPRVPARPLAAVEPTLHWGGGVPLFVHDPQTVGEVIYRYPSSRNKNTAEATTVVQRPILSPSAV